MNKRMRLIGIAAVGMIAMLLPLNAEAACGSEVSFGEYYTKITNVTNTASTRSSFWMVTTGNTAIGPGNDNGNVNESGTWLVPYGTSFAVLSGWAAVGEYDGCADSAGSTDSQRMAFAISDIVGGVPMYLAACTDRDTGAALQFQFDVPAGCSPGPPSTCVDTPLVPIPKPTVTGTTRVGNQANITIAAPNFSPGYKTDGSIGCEMNTVIPQYDVYVQQIARGAVPDSTRDAGPSWVLQGTGTAGLPFSFTTACALPSPGCDIFLAVSPKYSSGFTTGEPATAQAVRVSVNSSKLQAGPILAEPPKPRIANPKIAQ